MRPWRPSHRRQGDRRRRARGGRARRSSGCERPARPPGLATVLVGDDPASQIYVASKHSACEEAGIRSIGHELPADTAQEDLVDLVAELNADDAGQRHPRPAAAARAPRRGARSSPRSIRARTSTGSRRQRRAARPGPRRRSFPATPSGVMVLLREAGWSSRAPRRSSSGASDLVGKPGRVAAARRERDRDGLPLAHPRPRRRSPARATCWWRPSGIPRLVTGDMVKPGATVIDVGTNRTEDGLVGDVDFEPRPRGRRRDHAGARRGRPDDDRDAACRTP